MTTENQFKKYKLKNFDAEIEVCLQPMTRAEHWRSKGWWVPKFLGFGKGYKVWRKVGGKEYYFGFCTAGSVARALELAP